MEETASGGGWCITAVAEHAAGAAGGYTQLVSQSGWMCAQWCVLVEGQSHGWQQLIERVAECWSCGWLGAASAVTAGCWFTPMGRAPGCFLAMKAGGGCFGGRL